MKRFIEIFNKAEAAISGVLLCLISVLVFISAVARTVGRPINWTQDVALLAFAWLTFIGADVLAKSGKLINIDMLINFFPKWLQKALAVIFDVMAMAFLATLAIYGCQLVSESWARMFNTLHLSYAWCTLAVPVGTALLFLTMACRTVSDIKKPAKEWGA